ncbi:lipopolysaccharide transport periplasmic protein LptA [Desulfobacterota bacterium M19]
MKYTKLLCLLTLLCLLPPLTAIAAPGGPEPGRKPVQIEADHMLSTPKDNSVFFSGRVVARQGMMTINADELTVYYNSTEKKKKINAQDTRDIKQMLARGHVKINQDNWVATGDTARYFAAQRKLIITGHTKVWQNGNMVSGERFILFLDSGKSIVEPGTGKGERVKAFFYPSRQDKTKNP